MSVMKEITKKEILDKIKLNEVHFEENQSDVDEMAQKDIEKGSGVKYRPIAFYEGQVYYGWLKELCIPGKRQQFKEGVQHVGWLLGDNHPILFNLNKDVEEFFVEKKDVVSQLNDKFGKQNVKWVQEKLPKYQPFRDRKDEPQFLDVPGQEGGEEKPEYGYERTYGTMSLSTHLKNDVNSIIYDEFDDDKIKGKMFNELLSERSIPPILPRFREFVDNHTQQEWSNDNIFFRCISYNSYKSKEDFLHSVFERVTGQFSSESDRELMKTHSLARQFNNKYSRWDEARKMTSRYEGKTPIYNLDQRGYEALNLDVSIRMEFEIRGRREGSNFIWTVKMTNKFGEKLPTETYLRERFKEVSYKVSFAPNSILDDKSIIGTDTVNVGDQSFDEKENRITKNSDVMESLRKAIEDFKNKIEAIKPKSALKFASLEERNIERTGALNEDEIKDLVKDIIKKY
jgi:hypothetical protein